MANIAFPWNIILKRKIISDIKHFFIIRWWIIVPPHLSSCFWKSDILFILEQSNSEASSLPWAWWSWEKERERGKETSDTGASCVASSIMRPFTFCGFCWVESPLHFRSHSGMGVMAVTHFLNIFNHLYGPWLTSAPQLMSCHRCDWPPCAISETRYRLYVSMGVCVCDIPSWIYIPDSFKILSNSDFFFRRLSFLTPVRASTSAGKFPVPRALTSGKQTEFDLYSSQFSKV